MTLHTKSVIKRNSPPKLGGVPASLASRRGGSKAGLLQDSSLEPPRLAALGTPPNLGGEFFSGSKL
jgi:hypothetical protein